MTSDIESVKGGLSDSMKRAAVEWGIGRYLYGMTQKWVSIEQRGKGYVICNDERPTLDAVHDQWVQSLQQKKDHPGEQDKQGHHTRSQSADSHGRPRQQGRTACPSEAGRNPSAAAAAGTARAPAPAKPLRCRDSLPRPALRFPASRPVLSGDRRCPQAVR